MIRFFNILIFILLLSAFTRERNQCVEYHQIANKEIKNLTQFSGVNNQTILNYGPQFISSIEDESDKIKYTDVISSVETPAQKTYISIQLPGLLHCLNVILFESDNSPPVFS